MTRASHDVAPQEMVRARPWATLYLAAWTLLGGGALLYLALLVALPETMMARRAPAPSSEPDGNFGARNVMRLSMELDQIKATQRTLLTEIGQLRTSLAERQAQEKLTVERFAALEGRMASVPVALTAPPSAARVPKAADNRPASPPPAATKPPVEKAALETGSLANETRAPAANDAYTPTFGATTIVATRSTPQPAPPETRAAIRLAAGPSIDAIRLSWSLLLERHKPVLQSLEPRSIVDAAGGHELVAGPFKSRAEAASVCAALKARGAGCWTSAFGGDAL